MKWILLNFLFILPILLKAQPGEITYTLTLQITDEKGNSISEAEIKVYSWPQKVQIASKTTSGMDTNMIPVIFYLSPSRSTDSIMLEVSKAGYRNAQVFKHVDSLTLIKIRLISIPEELEEVIKRQTMMRQMGDTSEFNARAFKTNPDATSEDLVNKMPGFSQVDGKLQVQGEDVKQVLVDGKVFFGEDANTVLKNLPAEVVDKIQVFDRKSEQAQFTGFDDGNTTKTINIIMKPQFRQGTFGRMAVGAGLTGEYRGNVNYNRFEGESRLTVLGNLNNINEMNFTSEDLAGVMTGGGGGGRPGGGSGRRGPGGMSGGDAGNFMVDQKAGINSTRAAGVNYAQKWGKNTEFTGSYFFNQTLQDVQSDIYRKYAVNNGTWNYQESAPAASDNLNHRLNFRIEYKKDTSFGITVTPKFSWQFNDILSEKTGFTFINNLNSNQSLSKYTSQVSAWNGSLPVLLRKATQKKGRTISISLTPSFNGSRVNSEFAASTYFMNPYADTLIQDQRNEIFKDGITVNSNVTFTEPFHSKHAILASVGQNWQRNNSDRQTNSLNQNLYIFDSILSNTFKNIYQLYTGNLTWRYQLGKAIMNTGITIQHASLISQRNFPVQPDVLFGFTTFLPQFSLFGGNQKENIRINYRSSNNAPNIDQLQGVLNNTNPLQWYLGNPKLKQNESHNVHGRYSKTWSDKKISLFVGGGATWIIHYVGNDVLSSTQDSALEQGLVLPAGSQLIQYSNMNGYANYRTFISYGFPMFKSKINVNIHAGGNISKTPGRVNGSENMGTNQSLRAGVVISSNISQAFDFTVSSNTSISQFSNTLAALGIQNNLQQSTRLKINALLWKSFVLQASADYQINRGLSGGLSQDFILFNGEFGYKFSKDKAWDARIVIFDILGQNRAINRNITDWYVEDVKSNVLDRYYMFTLQYKFSKRGKGNSARLKLPAEPVR